MACSRNPAFYLALVLGASAAAHAQENTTDLSVFDSDSTQVVQELLDGSDEETTSWWQAVEGVPVLGAIATRPQSMRTYLRSRLVNPGINDHPAQDVRFEANGGDLWFGGRLQRDRGEQNIADLQRLAIRADTRYLELIGGDFRVGLGIGWTLGATPAFPSSFDPAAPLRNSGRGIRPQLSSEEGRGWRGIAVSLAPAPDQPARLLAWGGSASYDAHSEEGGVVLYAEQGNHSPDRLNKLVTVKETHLGTALEVPVAGVRVEASRLISRFNAPLSSADQPARFRFARESFGASGLAMKWGGPRKHSLSAEVSRQDLGAWGGGIVASLPSYQRARLVASLWRATVDFAPLHARPWIPSGSDPAGRSGIQIGLLDAFPSGARWTLTGSGELREARENNPETRDASASSSLLVRIGALSHFELRARVRRTWERGATAKDDRLLRLHYFVEDRHSRFDLRLQGRRGREGDGWGASLGGDHRLGRVLAFSVTGTYFATSGSGESILVIEPVLPGELTVINLSGRRLRLAFRLRASPFPGLEAVLRANVEHRLDAPSEPPESKSWAVGLIWRPPQTIHRGDT